MSCNNNSCNSTHTSSVLAVPLLNMLLPYISPLPFSHLKIHICQFILMDQVVDTANL